MKVVILAAGKGSRLGGNNLPKPLTHLKGGKTILGLQLEALSAHISLEQVIVIVGYHKEQIMEQFPGLLYVYNPDYATENTAKSLLRALKKLEEDVLWINGDVVFHPAVLSRLLATPRTSMVVNVGKVGEEEVKYRQDEHGRILEVSKTVSCPHGEALGINYCTPGDLARFRANLSLCSRLDYFERGLELCIQQGTDVWSVPVDAQLCTEIDFPEDLAKANQLLARWSSSCPGLG